MKALTIWQPWASLIAIGAKPYEFRSWVAPKSIWNKRIAIHAGVKKVSQSDIVDLIYRLEARQALGTALKAELALPLLQKVRQGLELPLGHVLGTAFLGIPTPSRSLPGTPAGAEINYLGQYAWPVTKFEALEPPQPFKGAQGFWDWWPERNAT